MANIYTDNPKFEAGMDLIKRLYWFDPKYQTWNPRIKGGIVSKELIKLEVEEWTRQL